VNSTLLGSEVDLDPESPPKLSKQEVLERNKWRPGQSGNPRGSNGKTPQHLALVRFLLEPDPDAEGGATRFSELMRATYAHSKAPEGGPDRKLLFEQAAGKARKSAEERILDLAEHMRSVARDQVEIGRALLGKRLETMTPPELAAFWKLCDQGIERYLEAAAQQIIGTAALTVDDAPAQISASLPAAPTTAQPNTGHEASPPEAGTIPEATPNQAQTTEQEGKEPRS
jgi:hypothetical protein